MLRRSFWTYSVVPLIAIHLIAALGRGNTESPQAERDRAARDVAVSGGVAVASALANIDAVVLRSTIQPNLLKGNFGEAHMNRHLVKHFTKTGGWSPLQARLSAQGIDGLYLKCDGAGQPTGLIVSEAKYGSSRLKQTADGIQMGKPWRTTRLDAMGKNYRLIAASIRSNTMTTAGPSGSVGKQRLQIDLPGSGKAAVFARAASNKPWEFVGPKRLLIEAGPQADRIGDYLQRASRGEVAYDSAIHRIKLIGGELRIEIKDAAALGPEMAESQLPIRRSLKVPLTERQLASGATILRSEIAKEIRKQSPRLSASDVNAYSKQIIRGPRDVEKFLNNRPPSVGSTIAWNSVKAGGVVAILDVTTQVLTQYLATGRVRWREVAVSGGIALASGTLGTAAGQATTAILVRSSVTQHLIARSSAVLGVGSARLLPQLIGGGVGGGVTSILFAVGGYAAGYYDASTAARMGVVGTSSFALGSIVAYHGLMALATTFGTASTGTAIATLHGAAATSAATAWLGGGAVAAGGGGAVVGGAVITGGVLVVAAGVGYCFYQSFAYFDERTDLRRIQLTIDRLARKTDFFAIGLPARSFSTVKINRP